MHSTSVQTSTSTPQTGLASVEVKERRRLHGANVLTPPERDPWWRQFLDKFNDPVIRILMQAAGGHPGWYQGWPLR